MRKKTRSAWWFQPLWIFRKYESKWKSSPNRDENKKYLKPWPRDRIGHISSITQPITRWWLKLSFNPFENYANVKLDDLFPPRIGVKIQQKYLKPPPNQSSSRPSDPNGMCHQLFQQSFGHLFHSWSCLQALFCTHQDILSKIDRRRLVTRPFLGVKKSDPGLGSSDQILPLSRLLQFLTNGLGTDEEPHKCCVWLSFGVRKW